MAEMKREIDMNRARVICIVLIAMVLFTLAGCGEKAKEQTRPERTAAVSEDGKWLGDGGCYRLETLVEGDYDRIRGNSDHTILSRTTQEDPTEQLYSKDEELLFENGIIFNYAVVDDGIWCFCEKGMVDGKYCTDCFMVNIGFDGKELKRFDVSAQGGDFAVNSGNIIIYDDLNNIMTIYDTDGKEQGKVNLSKAQLKDDCSGDLYTAGEGSLWLLADVQNVRTLYQVNLTTKSLDSSCVLPEDLLSLWMGTAENIFVINTKEGLAYFDPASNTVTNILYWDECSISSSEVDNFICDGDGFLCLSVAGLSRISPSDPSEIHPKIQLRVGTTIKYNGIEELAAKFNAQSDDYYVDVVDYSNDDKISQEDAQTKLNLDVLNGEGLDIVMLDDMDSLQNTSVFQDMYPLLDADEELNREDFFNLKALERGGKLLMAPSHLSVSTFYGLTDVVGERLGWTWDEYFEMEKKLPADGVMSSFLGADFFLKSSLELYAPHAIDWENGTCNFNTPEFISILEAAKNGYDPNCPDENPYFMNEANSMMSEGKIILESAYFSDVDSFAQSELYTNSSKLSYIGWPTPDGSCGSVFYVSGISICAATDQLDGCWEFAKYVLKSTYAYKPCFEKDIKEATLTKDKETADEKKKFALTQEQAERYRSLLENITVATSSNSKISSIVNEEAKDMFEGNKTPEETAKIVQSKISMYVAERK